MKKLQPLFMSAILALLMFAASAHAQTAIVHVDGDNGLAQPNPPNPGDTWSNAYQFLPDALDRAAELIGPGGGFADAQLWVAATDPSNPYVPDRDAANPTGTADRNATFNLINNVTLYGGFLGTDHPVAPETLLSQRDPENNETVLSGDIPDPTPPGGPHDSCTDPHPDAGICYEPNPPGIPGCTNRFCCESVCAQFGFEYCCITEWDENCAIVASNLDCINNAYHVVTADGVDNSAVLDGFTVTKGFANGSGPLNQATGGGMLVIIGETTLVGDPIVARCIFVDNVGKSGGG